MRATTRLLLPLLSLGVLLSACKPPTKTDETASAPATTSETAPAPAVASSAPISIGYSDWPGWVAWDIVEQQGFFKKHGANVKLVWFPNYSDSLNALAAGQVDSNCQTWGDSMGPLAQGVPLKAVLVNDNSFGNDAMIAKPGIASVKDLKGKKVATELGTVDHFLMLKALEANGMAESDVQFVNIKVQDCPAAMLAGKIDAAVVWEPSRSKILQDMKGSKSVFDSSSIPGLIPDLLVMKSDIVEKQPEEIQKIVDAWYDAMDWWKAHPDDAVKIMAKRTDSPVDFYKGFIKGTRIFSASEAMASMTRSDKVTSLYKSGDEVAQFLLKAKQIPQVPDYAAAIDSQFTKASLDKGLGKMPPYEYAMKVASQP
jgi:NitT/TauT family transport system substrate-binding protein